MRRLNNKGYMLVEIIVASVIAFGVAYYLLNLTYNFKDKLEDIYNEEEMIAAKVNITKNIMSDIESAQSIEIFACSSSSEESTQYKVSFTINEVDSLTDGKYAEISVDSSTLTYSLGDNTYQKKLTNGSEFGKITCHDGYVKIPITNIYSDKVYYVNLFLNK